MWFPCRLTNSPWLSSQSCWVCGFQAAGQRFRPTCTASGSRALCFLAGMSPCSLVPSYRQLCESPGRLVLAVPRGSAAHRFVWVAGWHAAPRVLIWCQLSSISPYPPVLLCSPACLHPASTDRKYENKRISDAACPARLVGKQSRAGDSKGELAACCLLGV